MARSHRVHEGAEFLENWASELLRVKGHAIDPPEIWSDGMKRAVDGLFMTNEEIISKASAYQEWKDRKRLFLEYLNRYQDSVNH